MPIGHLVDLVCAEGLLVYLGAPIAELLIMVGLISDRAAMAAVMTVEGAC